MSFSAMATSVRTAVPLVGHGALCPTVSAAPCDSRRLSCQPGRLTRRVVVSSADRSTDVTPNCHIERPSPSNENGEPLTVLRDDRASRRVFLPALFGSSLAAMAVFKAEASDAPPKYAEMPALKGKDYGKTQTVYPDYVLTDSGLQYKDLREGNGPTPQEGQTVVIDWDGFTIGYYGRIFEARNKAKGGSFEGGEKDFFRFRLGGGQVIAAFEEAVATMHVGGIRRVVVPPDLGYPNNDFNSKGPKPMTFSGQRALDFVLRNQGLIDKTLLFDIELMRIIDT